MLTCPLRLAVETYRVLSLRCETRNRTEVAFYVDTSASVKLVVAEPETPALQKWLGEQVESWLPATSPGPN